MPKVPNVYRHIPISTRDDGTPNSITDTPVWHDGSQIGAEELLSGDMHLTIKALTPLLVANDQFEARQVEGAEPTDDGRVFLPQSWQLHTGGDEQQEIAVDKQKAILEPLRLNDKCRRVAIAGTAFKGMLAQLLGALTSAPMARVWEQSYSYRPNLQYEESKCTLRAPRVSLVRKHDAQNGSLEVITLNANAMNQVHFIRDEAWGHMREFASKTRNGVKCFEVSKTVDKVRIDPTEMGKSIVSYRVNQDTSASGLDISDFYIFDYAGGTDCDGQFARMFNSRGKTYKHVMIKKDIVDSGHAMTIEVDILHQHDLTTDHLRDTRHGHLRATHPLVAKNSLMPDSLRKSIVKRNKNIRTPGRMIYVEVEQTQGSNPDRIVSVGQNFRYRWRFRDSIRKRWAGHKDKEAERSILVPLAKEQPAPVVGTPPKDCPPQQLSTVRLLLGYAIDRDNNGTIGIGTGDFEQLAGRLAFNMAVEVIAEGKEADADRFVGSNGLFAVPLKILAGPKTSAEMDYLEQTDDYRLRKQMRSDAGHYFTYGDLLSENGGELAGRKFYRHQPIAAKQPNQYRAHLAHPENREIVAGKQAALARYLSKPGSEFRVSLRFRDLRPWELGAVSDVSTARAFVQP